MKRAMLFFTLRQSYGAAMSSEAARQDFYARAQEAVMALEAAEKRIAELEQKLERKK